jgi:FAE1/Type III polyketide synthase-like protein
MTNDDSHPDTIRDPDIGTRCALDQAIARLGRDEHRVLTRIAERLALGATTYGPLAIASDPRSWKSREAREEVEDALVYFACAWLKSEEVTP